MPDKFWNVYNYVARQWYETEYGKVEYPARWYSHAMIFMETMAYSELRRQRRLMEGRSV